MAVLQYVFIFVVFFFMDSLETSEFQTCPDGPRPADLIIEGCDKLPCDLIRGTDKKFDVTFDVIASTKTLRPLVNAKVGGINVPFPLPDQDACKNLLDADCPLDKGEQVTYRLVMPVLKMYPKISLEIQFSLIDEQKRVQVCFRVPCQVVDK